jgi:hypothetical protein
MTLLCLEFSVEQVEPLWGLDVPGVREPINKAHCTMVYFGKGGSIVEAWPALQIIEEVAQLSKPFSLEVQDITSFDPSDSSDNLRPIICKVQSPYLLALRAGITSALGRAGVEYNNKFPDYHPHITLAYQDPSEPWKDIRLETPWRIGIASLSVLFGKHGDTQQTTVTFPLRAGEGTVTSAARVASRWTSLRVG